MIMARESVQQTPERQGARRRRAGPTVADVAREAGVSQMTVSRVVNRETNVQDSTRERVERVIKKLGYVPNPAARSLAGGKQCRIALLYINPSAAYLSEILVGCLAGTAESDAQLAIEHWDGAETAEALAHRFVAHRTDGVLLTPPLSEDAHLLAALVKSGLPMAQVVTGRPADAAHAVAISDVDAARAMTEYLIGLGHRRIGFITGNVHHGSSGLRRIGYEAALRHAGLPVDPGLTHLGDYTYRSGLAAAEGLLDLPEPPTAIFASNDDMAAAVISVAHRRQLSIPGDLSVCGFDDTAMATTVWPELTTIRQPIAEMAREAARLLASAIRDGHDGRPAVPTLHRFQFELIVRGSAGPPKA